MDKKKKTQRIPDNILCRFIAPEKEVLKLLRETEEHYGIRLYPTAPVFDDWHPGCVRVYCYIPIDRSPVEKGGDDVE